MLKKISVRHVSGLDDTIGKKVGLLELDGDSLFIETAFGTPLAKIKTERIALAVVVHEEVSGGLFKKKQAPRLWIDYKLKDGSTKRLVFEPSNETQAQTFWNELIQITSQNKPAAIPEEADDGASLERIHVRGVENYQDAFYELVTENPDFEKSKRELIEDDQVGERVYKYEITDCDVDLRPEPDNSYDPNAIAAYFDGLLIGYVPRGSTTHVRNLLQRRIVSITGEVGGGPYKIVDEVDDDVFEMEQDATKLWATVSIRYKKDE